ncbi:MAG TPA: glycosyltransferase family 4 protein [Acidobacteriaceae bacterium]|nr:glycosyltransferase family 4 protein [Acidobacteriaceae bacterium]
MHVFYGWEGGARGAALDHGFGRAVQWDVPLLGGYEYTFVPNESGDPGPHHFLGIRSSALVPTVRQWAPDAVLVYGWSYLGHLSALRAFHGKVPLIFRGDSTLLEESGAVRPLLRRRVLSLVYRHIDCALYVGRRNQEYFRAHGVPASRLVWAPHSVNNDHFKDADGSHRRRAHEIRQSLGIPDGAPVAVFAGKLESIKAPDLLLKSFHMRSTREAHLIFAGSGALERDLRRTASADPNVHFIGFQNQSLMPAVYRLGDIAVLPSRCETWGLAVNEAMASERAVIVSDHVGCAADLVVEGETGLTFPRGNAEALRKVLDAALQDVARSQDMGAAAARMINGWSLSEQASRIENAVLDLSRNRGYSENALRSAGAARV